MQLVVDEGSREETVHGYFNLDEQHKTRLDLTSYDKCNMKWIRFTCFEPSSPQQRAWFIPIKGLAFGKPRHLLARQSNMICDDAANLGWGPEMQNHIAVVENMA